MCYDRFFPRQHTSSRQQSSSGCRVALDLNSVQSAFDAGIITMYAASLAAAITFSQGGEKALESIWLSYMPLFVVPNAVIGYHARILYRRICPRRKSAGIKPEEDDNQHEGGDDENAQRLRASACAAAILDHARILCHRMCLRRKSAQIKPEVDDQQREGGDDQDDDSGEVSVEVRRPLPPPSPPPAPPTAWSAPSSTKADGA